MRTCKPSKPKIAITICYMLLILATSLVPGFEISGSESISIATQFIQNLLHIPMFAILSILFLQIARNYDIGRWKAGSLTFVFCGIFGLLNEIIQLFIPGRFGGLMDIGLNSIGAIIGILIYFSVEKCRPGLIYRIICT
jgi:glycopeptide antibiotics resistance protein